MATAPKVFVDRIERVAIETLRPNPRNARTHTKRQIKLIAESLKAFGFVNPILIDETGMIVAGHGRVAAAKQLGMTQAPAIRVEHLGDDEKRAYVLADNQLAARAGWDPEMLAIELQHLIEVVVDFDVTVTGFEMPQIDLLIEGTKAPRSDDLVQPIDRSGAAMARSGDLWQLGQHRILCADGLRMASYATLMGGDLAKIAFADPPYNVPIGGFVSQSARRADRRRVRRLPEKRDGLRPPLQHRRRDAVLVPGLAPSVRTFERSARGWPRTVELLRMGQRQRRDGRPLSVAP
jgi:ParB-like nuclease domain